LTICLVTRKLTIESPEADLFWGRGGWRKMSQGWSSWKALFQQESSEELSSTHPFPTMALCVGPSGYTSIHFTKHYPLHQAAATEKGHSSNP
jgi:hypothetical protein